MRRDDANDGKDPGTITLTEMTSRAFGEKWAYGVTFIYLCLGVILLVAYIDKAGETLEPSLGIPEKIGGPFFAVSVGGVIAAGGFRAADNVNRVGTVMLMATFLLVCWEAGKSADFSLLTEPPSSWASLIKSIPVVFLSLSYHDFLPVLARFLKGNVRKLKLSISIGSGVALLMFLVWDSVAFANSEGRLSWHKPS